MRESRKVKHGTSPFIREAKPACEFIPKYTPHLLEEMTSTTEVVCKASHTKEVWMVSPLALLEVSQLDPDT